jgi:hypothetical protein
MTVNSISAAGLSQEVLSSSDAVEQQALQTLQNGLALGDLTDAQSAFLNLQTILQDSATGNGTTAGSNSQLTNDLNTLRDALQLGNLSNAQSAFTTVLGDLQGTASAAEINEATAASQSLQLVEDLLSTVDSTNPSQTSLDQTTSILEGIYGSDSGLDVYA